MADDPKLLFCQMVARLGRETQLHLDERHKHFRITDAVLVAMSVLLFVIAIVNVYYVRILYQDLNGIVDNMDSMHTHLRGVRNDMVAITERVGAIDGHIQHMDEINAHTGTIASTLPEISGSMSRIGGEMQVIEQDMAQMSAGMTNVDVRFGEMTGGVAGMRENVRQISRPMGVMNQMMP